MAEITWFKVDDGLHEHPKTRRAGVGRDLVGLAAVGLWVIGGSYSADNLTDGFVPEHTLTRWAHSRVVGRKLAGRLVEAGLWTPDEVEGEQGWRFHEWAERQPLRERVLSTRAARAEAGKAGGEASGRSRREAKPKQLATGALEPPSRPVPSRPDLVVTSVGQSCSLTRVDDEGLMRIAQMTKGDRTHAEATAELVLSKTTSAINNPTAYVLAAIRVEPERYRYRRGNPKKGQECPDHPGEWADACRAHIADRKAAQ